MQLMDQHHTLLALVLAGLHHQTLSYPQGLGKPVQFRYTLYFSWLAKQACGYCFPHPAPKFRNGIQPLLNHPFLHKLGKCHFYTSCTATS